MPVYPTKEEILAQLYTPTENEYNAVRKWKRTQYNKQWADLSVEQKMERLKMLISNLCESRGIPRDQWPILMTSEHPWGYTDEMKLITMGMASPSVISTLHEFGHYLHFSGLLEGDRALTELVACRYSVGIYKTCFPKSFTKLTWAEHTLVVAKESEKNSEQQQS